MVVAAASGTRPPRAPAGPSLRRMLRARLSTVGRRRWSLRCPEDLHRANGDQRSGRLARDQLTADDCREQGKAVISAHKEVEDDSCSTADDHCCKQRHPSLEEQVTDCGIASRNDGPADGGCGHGDEDD